MKTIPQVPKALLEHLKERFRGPSVTPRADIRDMMFDAGALKVIEYLDRQYQKQQEANVPQ